MKIITSFVVSLIFSLAFFLGTFTIESALFGLICGFIFSIALFWFPNSKLIKNQTALNKDRLFDAEKIENSFFANLIIKPEHFKLNDFAFDDYFKYLGMKNQEALGGRLHLSNYRLIFKTHRYNRIRGEFSIFLSEIKNIEIKRSFLHQKMTIHTNGSVLNLVVDHPQKIKDAILQLKSQTGPQEIEELRKLVKENPEKCIDSTEAWKLANKINDLLRLKSKVEQVASVVQSPISGLASFYYNEFTDKTLITEKRDKKD